MLDVLQAIESKMSFQTTLFPSTLADRQIDRDKEANKKGQCQNPF